MISTVWLVHERILQAFYQKKVHRVYTIQGLYNQVRLWSRVAAGAYGQLTVRDLVI